MVDVGLDASTPGVPSDTLPFPAVGVGALPGSSAFPPFLHLIWWEPLRSSPARASGVSWRWSPHCWADLQAGWPELVLSPQHGFQKSGPLYVDWITESLLGDLNFWNFRCELRWGDAEARHRMCVCLCVCVCMGARGNGQICDLNRETDWSALPIVLLRTCYIICGPSAKWKCEVPCSKWLSISRWWQQRIKPSVGPSKHGVLCDCTGHTCTEPTLITLYFQLLFEAGRTSLYVFLLCNGRLWRAGLTYFSKCLFWFHKSAHGLH